MIASTLLFVATAMSAAVSATPVRTTGSTENDAATVNFTPYAVVGCRMSEDPYSGLEPTTYNITTGSGCITPSYAFQSYVESSNSLAADGPCSLSLYSGADCTGDVTAATLSTYAQCVAGAVSAQSMLLACGP